MISASHNPYQDNGIKVFGHTGYKLPDEEEHAIEEEISACSRRASIRSRWKFRWTGARPALSGQPSLHPGDSARRR